MNVIRCISVEVESAAPFKQAPSRDLVETNKKGHNDSILFILLFPFVDVTSIED